MILHQLRLCFRLAILLLACTKTGDAIAYEDKEILVSTKWQQEVYENDNTEKVTREITYKTGIKERKRDTRTIEATQSVGEIAKGALFQILRLEFSYSFMQRSESVTMLETEIYESREIKTIVTIPPKSTLTRWELIADVAGTKIGYSLNIDTLKDTNNCPHTFISRATVRVPRRINYGHTSIRIKHSKKQQYITVTKRKNWPAATLGYSSSYHFILCENIRGVRIRTLNSMYPGYEWAYSAKAGGIYFDWSSDNSDVDKQHWRISKKPPLYDGDEVAFQNKYYNDSAMCYHDGPDTNVYCFEGSDDKWVLEIVEAVDFPFDHCI